MPKVESFSQIVEFVRGLPPRRQATLALAAVGVLAMLWVFVQTVGTPPYETLYSGLSPAEAQEIGLDLASRGVAYEISPSGTDVSVPSDQLDSVRLAMASEGLPRSGRLGFELFDTPNWAGSDFAERVNYQRALEAELERTIQALEEVESVRVHLVMPRESLFLSQERGAKAAVLVKLQGARLRPEAADAITYLVSSSVDNLSPDEVTVINADSGTALASGNPDPLSAGGGDLESDLTDKVIATLSPIVGFDGVRATVTVEYDLNHSEQTAEVYDPNGVVVLSSQQSEEQQTDAITGGIPGTASNVPSAEPVEVVAQPPGVASGSQLLRSEATQYAVSKSVTHLIEPAGRIRRIATAVLVDDAREYSGTDGEIVEDRREWTPEEMQQIRDLAMAAVGFDADRGDQLTVENVSFGTAPGISLPTPSLNQRLLDNVQGWQIAFREWRTPLRYVWAAVLLVLFYFLVVGPLKKQLVVAASASRSQLAGATVGQVGTVNPDAIAGSREQIASSRTGESVPQQSLAERVKDDPANAARVIQSWLGPVDGQNGDSV